MAQYLYEAGIEELASSDPANAEVARSLEQDYLRIREEIDNMTAYIEIMQVARALATRSPRA